MPLDIPQTSTSDITWVVNGRVSANSVTAFQVVITTEGTPDTEAEGDALLQGLVDLLSTRYYNVSGTKGYTAYTTRNMTVS
ncbi:hypothetical protein ABZX77_30585 [Streptomyces sp. NPDC004237]|uniref:hypothetical protein n=1 Tax=Streptomyces sp. NPDC004237 TaxID=3154455 RepID=UPI0033B8C351